MTDAAIETSLLRHPSFVMFWFARTFTNGAYQMLVVGVGWQLYDLTNDPFDLGLVGLIQFFPFIVSGLIGGLIIDHFDRRRVAAACQITKALCAAALAYGSISGIVSREIIFVTVLVAGVARALEIPTLHALMPGLVPPPILPRAIASSAAAQQASTICGPAIGGFLYLLGAAVVYEACAAVFILASVLVSLIAITPRTGERRAVTLQTIFAGFTYLRAQPTLMGAILLDLFIVLISGVTALLPIFARDILDAGPWGLGLLRSAPGVGALTISIILSHVTIERKAGVILLATVLIFGLSTIVFAFSTSLVVSLLALVVHGAADAVSVVIRHSLVQITTPNEMLGRVFAVNTIFTGTSGTLGDFRAGAIAAAAGPVASAVIGGIGAITIALIWWRIFPQLSKIERLAPER